MIDYPNRERVRDRFILKNATSSTRPRPRPLSEREPGGSASGLSRASLEVRESIDRSHDRTELILSSPKVLSLCGVYVSLRYKLEEDSHISHPFLAVACFHSLTPFKGNRRVI